MDNEWASLPITSPVIENPTFRDVLQYPELLRLVCRHNADELSKVGLGKFTRAGAAYLSQRIAADGQQGNNYYSNFISEDQQLKTAIKRSLGQTGNHGSQERIDSPQVPYAGQTTTHNERIDSPQVPYAGQTTMYNGHGASQQGIRPGNPRDADLITEEQLKTAGSALGDDDMTRIAIMNSLADQQYNGIKRSLGQTGNHGSQERIDSPQVPYAGQTTTHNGHAASQQGIRPGNPRGADLVTKEQLKTALHASSQQRIRVEKPPGADPHAPSVRRSRIEEPHGADERIDSPQVPYAGQTTTHNLHATSHQRNRIERPHGADGHTASQQRIRPGNPHGADQESIASQQVPYAE
eukprot:Lankesteria_metandrocarpae@DN5241_c2_g1_i4.p1